MAGFSHGKIPVLGSTDHLGVEASYLRGIYIYSQYGSVSKPCTPVVHIKIAGKWMFIPLKMVLIGIDPYPYVLRYSVYLHMDIKPHIDFSQEYHTPAPSHGPLKGRRCVI